MSRLPRAALNIYYLLESILVQTDKTMTNNDNWSHVVVVKVVKVSNASVKFNFRYGLAIAVPSHTIAFDQAPMP